MASDRVPSFYLYGEPHRAVAEGFTHVEALDDRSRPSEWTIRAHAHADLVQIFVVHAGGGTMQADTRVLHFNAPALLLVPTGVVHGFSWISDSAGAVVTLAQSYFGELLARHPDFERIFVNPRVIRPNKELFCALQTHTAALQSELGWSVPGHSAAVEAALLALFVATLRALSPEAGETQSPRGQQAALVARYRERIGARFRLRESVASHATALCTSETSLRAACARVAGRSPAAMLDERAMLEARRTLLYTNLSVAEVGYALGFADPAYFTRFFTRHAGRSPRAFRQEPAPVESQAKH
ncbi:helix-turn-helix domain-containing protein [Sphingomonas faeni]|uniref:helix-turn-helix domain-containing protein n=1 Tax=Sphingomonas faeni TaxID=185950 RepID=UPI0024134E60|nr:helix-turn-helix domain-containing protein [Sphingomonas faeni]